MRTLSMDRTHVLIMLTYNIIDSTDTIPWACSLLKRTLWITCRSQENMLAVEEQDVHGFSHAIVVILVIGVERRAAAM